MSEGGVAIRVAADGRIELALTALRKSSGAYCGYVMNAREDALFLITTGERGIELMTTAGEPVWSRAWRLPVNGTVDYRALDPAIPLAAADFAELEALAQEFVARWIWFRNGPHEETAIEAGRFTALGCAIADANVRSAALTRLRAGATGAIRYSELDAAGAWIEDALARCWAGERS